MKTTNHLWLKLGITVCFACFVINPVTSQTSNDLKNLVDTLFDSYSSKVRPVVNQQHPLQLDVSFYVSSVNEVNEVDEKMVTTGYLELSWTDELLKWTPADYNNTDTIFVPQNDIWKPDLVLKNGFKKFEELGGKFYYLSIVHVGGVIWLPFDVFETRCSMDITKFPFDTQSCDIKFITWSHTVDQIEISKSTNGIQFYNYEENGVWKIVDTSSMIKKDQSESEIDFTIKLQRKPLYYVMNIILPVIFLGYLNILVFVIPVDAGEKMSFSVTVFLSFAVFLTIISALLPTSSTSIPILAIYLVIQLVYGVLALIISAFQLRLRHRDETEEVHAFWVKAIKLQQRLRCKKYSQVENLNNNDEKEGKEAVRNNYVAPAETFGWNQVASSIDFFAFWFFSITNSLISIVMFAMAANM
ncbi:neuronal acetylcholine receptor subunit alpha-3-like [Crassostrea angulata]|uniref:neuronal acetylcholine receptor subunit alpha-3-like n=1 Tax=Magallana angulata TaxID=2784310 RepID=UPI0022B0FF1D|nr:neuronal acetylcholine receptor subunit alpha-3-like [Crassostrea angulata]